MAIGSFRDNETKAFFVSGRRPRKRGWSSIAKIVQRKIDMLHYAKELSDLRSPPNNHLEALTDDLKGFYSIRVNDQWRIVFRWDKQPEDVQILDYH